MSISNDISEAGMNDIHLDFTSSTIQDQEQYTTHQEQAAQKTATFEGETSNSTNESYCSNIIEESAYKPDVPEEFVPVVNSVFETLEMGMKMYTDYAEMAGFNTRLSTQSRFRDKTINIKYVICNKGGKDEAKSCDTLTDNSVKRKQNSSKIITGCTAKIIFECVTGTTNYRVKKFSEMHNHPLESIEDRCHMKKARKMSYAEKEFVIRASTVKVGPTMAHKMRATFKGGYQYVGAKVADYKNLRRGVCRILGYKDAQIMINKMNDRKDNLPNYSFEFLRDGDQLSAMFWADEREKAFYDQFGEVVSFDATFRTNKYKMVFVPFTAIDHHKKSVTVGAALLSKENIESYEWMLKAFLRAHNAKEPKINLTDQDPAIKQAVENVLPNTRHRLCMWHIMKKLQAKVTGDLFRNEDFKKRFNKLVWDMHIKPDEFENKWKLIINEFNLEDKRWFNDMFELRDKWIPAYFNDARMFGLMKTTSRSESMNSFFNTCSQSGNLLLHFMMNYDTAIQKQRNNQKELDQKTKKAVYKFLTPREIEKHAATVYTSTLFFEVQKEIFKGAWFCSYSNASKENGWEVYTVQHNNKNGDLKNEFKVQIKLPEKDIECTCQHFNRFGTLCRHAFNILMKHGIKEIPEQYIKSRWTKDVISKQYQFGINVFDTSDGDNVKLVNEAYYNFEACLDLVRQNKEKLTSFVKKTESMLKEYENDPTNESIKNRTDVDMVSRLMGVPIPKNIEINVPQVQSNKGSGKKNRIPSATEKLHQNKKTRACSVCGQRTHNVRTCPSKIAAEKSSKFP